MFILNILFFFGLILVSKESKNDEEKSPIASEVKFDIIGDTSHLFEPEDFEKKEAIPLGNSTLNQTIDKPKVQSNNPPCLKKNSTESNKVKLVNGSVLTQTLYDSDQNECFLVLFYVPWCPFSAKLAPYFNALPRAFPSLDFLAFDVSKSIGYNTKFGASAVPMIILFQQRNVISKFNYTEKNFTDFVEFVANKSGIIGDNEVTLNELDFEGPVPTEPLIGTDYYLWLAWAFLVFVSIDFLIRKTNFTQQILKFIRYIILFIRPIRFNEIREPPRLPAIENQHNFHPHSD